MSELISAVLQVVKLAPKYLAPVGVMAGLLLFLPEDALEVLGVSELAEDHRPVLGLVFLFCAIAAVFGILRWGWKGMRRVLDRRSAFQKTVERLQVLNEDEKQILRYYIQFETRSNMLRASDGVVQGLVAARILVRASNLGSLVQGFAYYITDTAWYYLQVHPHLLAGHTDTYRTDGEESRGLWR